MKISPARTSAFDILLRIEREKAFSSILLPTYEEKLSADDRALCHELVLGTLRNKIWLDRNIDVFTSVTKLDLEVCIALRLGLYQLYFLSRVPHYAVINDSVSLVQRARKSSAKSLVNAILRKASREKSPLKFKDEVERISIENSHPFWLIEKWALQIGKNETEKLARANNTPPCRAFRLVGKGKEDIDPLLQSSVTSTNVDGCYILENHIPNQPDSVYFQDEASQMTAVSVTIEKGGRFLDVCAAPGGKTTLIAQRNRHAKLIVAGDIHANRVKFLKENCLRHGVDVAVVQFDAEMRLPFADGIFDTVFVDAPCSGTGTIRQNPEIRYFIEPRDFVDLPAKQLRILEQASELLKRGGLLVYSTCSVEREENEEVCVQFMNVNKNFRKTKPRVPDRFITAEGFARTWPHRDNMDGFFIASFVRI